NKKFVPHKLIYNILHSKNLHKENKYHLQKKVHRKYEIYKNQNNKNRKKDKKVDIQQWGAPRKHGEKKRHY
ncbi:hypothetical protein ACQWE9_25215, partial [Salmonella enterica subsp. enterica serovar Infantis]